MSQLAYPSIVQLETTAACNAHCSFCPHSSMGRSAGQRMSEELFHNLVDQMATWSTPPSTICPFLTNEPFADNRIYDFCRYINLMLPATKLVFFTNGSLFTDGNLDKLAAVQNIDLIHISWHHGNKAAYEAELGLSWERSIESVQRLINRRRYNVRIARVQDGDPAKDTEFMDFSQRTFGPVNRMLCMRYNWKGDIGSPYPANLDIHCSRHSALCVLADGRVPLCCMDQLGTYQLGDANTSPLFYIYNSPRAVAYRSRTKRHSEPCNRCNVS